MIHFTEHSFRHNEFPKIECAVLFVHESSEKWMRGTGVAIVLPDGAVFHGISLCSPKDTFSKKDGRHNAFERAAKLLFLSKRNPEYPAHVPINHVDVKDDRAIFNLTNMLYVEIAEAKHPHRLRAIRRINRRVAQLNRLRDKIHA